MRAAYGGQLPVEDHRVHYDRIHDDRVDDGIHSVITDWELAPPPLQTWPDMAIRKELSHEGRHFRLWPD